MKKKIYIDIIANRSITGPAIITRDDEPRWEERRYLLRLIKISKNSFGTDAQSANDQKKHTKINKLIKNRFKLWFSFHLRLLQMQLQIATAKPTSFRLKKVHGVGRKGKHPVAAYYGNYLRREKSPREIEHEAFPRFIQTPSTLRHQINNLHKATQTPETSTSCRQPP